MIKDELRKEIRTKRCELDEDTVRNSATAIWNRLKELKEFKNTSRIYVYHAFRNEVDTCNIIQYGFDHGIEICLPKIHDKTMDFYKITSYKQLKKGYMGILEPDETARKVELHHGIVIVPGTAFDNNCNRMGYGGGYYDRFLFKNPNLTKIGIAYDFQIFDTIPVESYDIPMDYVITENTTIKRD